MPADQAPLRLRPFALPTVPDKQLLKRMPVQALECGLLSALRNMQEAAERALAAQCTFHPTVSRRGQSAPPARPSFLTADGDSVTEKIDEYDTPIFRIA